MSDSLHIIENDGLLGLANSLGYEKVECVYNKIKPLESGKYIVVKDRNAGILDSEGKILFYPRPGFLYYIKGIDFFKYKVEGKISFFTFINEDIYYLSVDKIKFDEKTRIINVYKDGLLYIYNDKFKPISTDYEQILPTSFRQRKNSRFYLGLRHGMWGVFRIKIMPKHKHEITPIIDNLYINPEDALFALKKAKL